MAVFFSIDDVSFILMTGISPEVMVQVRRQNTRRYQGVLHAESSHSALLETLSDEGLLAGDAEAAESLVLEVLRGVTDLSKVSSSHMKHALHHVFLSHGICCLPHQCLQLCIWPNEAQMAPVDCKGQPDYRL